MHPRVKIGNLIRVH